MILKKTVQYKLQKTAFILLTGFMLAGCGKKTTNIDEGMKSVEELNYDIALQSFDKAILEGENLELAYRGQGLAYLGQTDYESAVKSFYKALENAGMFVTDVEVDINYYLATAQYKNNQLQEAVKTLDAIAGLKSKQADVYYLRGTIKMETGDYDNAVKDLNQALACSKNDIAMTVKVFQVFADNGHEEEGKAYLSTAVDNRLDVMTDYEKGIVYYYLEDYENARNFLETYKNANKDSGVETLLMLGKTYEQLGDSNYAASIYNKYLEENGGDAIIYNQLGLCKLQTEEYDAALSAFNNGIAIKENNIVIQQLKYNQIVAYEYLGEFTKAASLMNTYLDTYPDDAAAKREYEFLKTR